jgi:hypothetical protein
MDWKWETKGRIDNESDEKVVLGKIRKHLERLSKLPLKEIRKHIVLYIDPHSVEHGEFAGDEVW